MVTTDEHFDISILSIGEQLLEGDFVVPKLARSAFILCASGSPDSGPNSVLVPAGKIALTTSHIDMMLASGLAGVGIIAVPSFVAQIPFCHQWLSKVTT